MGFVRIYNLFTLFKDNFDLFREKILKNIELKKEEKVLDFGCGTGSFCVLFDKKNYVGFDIDKKRVAYARKKYPGYNFFVMDANNLRFNEKFDKVLVVGVFHHLKDNEVLNALKQLKELVKVNGFILAIEPTTSKNWLRNLWMNTLDRGKYIRSEQGYNSLFEQYFEVHLKSQFLTKLFYKESIYKLT